MAESLQPARSRALPWSEIWTRPYRQAPSLGTSLATRLAASLGARWLKGIEGETGYRTENDPYIAVLNHNQKLESIFLPSVLFHLREGRPVRFLADWNYCLVPPVWFFYHFGRVITVARKPARPRFLNIFKPWFVRGASGLAQARQALEQGDSIGLFPEGTINRSPDRLLPGHLGAARLSLQARVPVLPIGVRFPEHDASLPIPEFVPMAIRVGALMEPPAVEGPASKDEVKGWHGCIMESLASLSGKAWKPRW